MIVAFGNPDEKWPSFPPQRFFGEYGHVRPRIKRQKIFRDFNVPFMRPPFDKANSLSEFPEGNWDLFQTFLNGSCLFDLKNRGRSEAAVLSLGRHGRLHD
jgi:hypothetical protein